LVTFASIRFPPPVVDRDVFAKIEVSGGSFMDHARHGIG
jgi:hypothetical protein